MEEFNVFIEKMELLDPLPLGRIFTWYRLDGKAMKRLDRILLLRGLLEAWKVGGLVAGPRDLSNHFPIWFKSNS
ncbi:unnamed protein product [Lathyrus sativus]|nr:unnamed protein product [Lathyrus sativus]